MVQKALICCLASGLALAGVKAAGRSGKGAEKKDGWEQTTNDEGKVVQQLKIEAPSMTEEDQYGYKMPDRYKCDSCRAVMFHLSAALKKVHPKSRKMKQWEYTDTFDEACRNSFEGYGVKLLNGENTLSGPGLTHDTDGLAPGSGAIQMGGETWTKRLNEACRNIVYERVGEDELYEKYREDGGLSEAVCFQDLRDCETGPKVPPKPREDAAEEKPKEDKVKAKKEKKEKEKKDKAKSKEPKAAAQQSSVSAANSRAAQSAGAASEDAKVDVTTFLRTLAVQHGLSSDEYLSSRTEREWEKLTLAMASRIFNRVVDTEPGQSCRAK